MAALRLGLFADSHYSDREISCRTRRPSHSYRKIGEAMRAFAAAGADAAVILGDLVDACRDRSSDRAELERVGRLITSFCLPVYCLRGNHDCDNFTAHDFYAISGLAEPPFSAPAGEGRVMIFLDANFRADGRRYLPHAVDWTDSSLPQEDVERLRRELARSDVGEATVFIHQRLDGCDDERYNIENSREIREILESSGKVRRVFQGHYHKGDLRTVNGIEYVTLAAMCEGEENSYTITEI